MTVEDMLQARQLGMQQAEQAANSEWLAWAAHHLLALAATGDPFTADDIIEVLEAEDIHTHNLSALGPVIQRAARQHIIKRTGRYVPSRIRRRHRDLVEWVGVQQEQQP